MSSFSPFLSLPDVYDYLPNFNADCDLQVGDWVMLQPWRAAALLAPLITAWEQKAKSPDASSPSTGCGEVPHYKLEELLPEPLTLRRRSLAWDGPGALPIPSRLPRLAPLSMARRHYCQRKRAHFSDASGETDDDAGAEKSESENGVLYFHMRLGLLTPSRPYIFGGLDIVEVLAWPCEDDSAEEDVLSDASSGGQPTTPPGTLYLNLLTGETLTRDEAVSRVSNALSFPSSTPSWSSPIEEAAEKEWEQWVAKKACKQLLAQPCS